MDFNSPEVPYQTKEQLKPAPLVLCISNNPGFPEFLRDQLKDVPLRIGAFYNTVADVIKSISLRKKINQPFDFVVTNTTKGLGNIKRQGIPIIYVGFGEDIESLSSEMQEKLGIKAALDLESEDFPAQFETAIEQKNK